MKVLGAVVVAVVAVALLFVSILRHPVYTPDGIVYARFAARDAGYSERDATLAARAFYDRSPLMRNPRYRALIDLDPSVSFARSRVFDNRVLYPWITGMLLPLAGFRALFLVNAAAYVCFGLGLFWMLSAFRRPVGALVLSVLALMLPAVRASAASDLTDMLSLFWWVLALGALLRLSRQSRGSLLALLAVSSALLALTRPTPYLVVLPAFALGIVRAQWMPLLASFGGVAAYAAVAAATHAYGIAEQLRWVYAHRPNPGRRSFAAWYRSSLFTSVRYVVAQSVRTVIPLLMLAAAVYGVLRTPTRAQMSVLAAALVACVVAVPFNPVPSSFARVIVLPLIPVFCGILQCTVEAFLAQRTAAASSGSREAAAPV